MDEQINGLVKTIQQLEKENANLKNTMEKNKYTVIQRSQLLDFMNFISKTPQAEFEMYSNEELVDNYILNKKI